MATNKLRGLSEIMRVELGGDKKWYTNVEIATLLNESSRIPVLDKPLTHERMGKMSSYLVATGWASKRQLTVEEGRQRGGRFEYMFKRSHNGKGSHPAPVIAKNIVHSSAGSEPDPIEFPPSRRYRQMSGLFIEVHGKKLELTDEQARSLLD